MQILCLTVLDVGALDLITYVLRCPLPSNIFRFSFTLPCVCIIKFMFVRLANKYYYYYYYYEFHRPKKYRFFVLK